MGRVALQQGAIGVAQAGGGERTPIVFLHGVGSDKSVWTPQLEHFGRTRPALAFDYPGYGESDLRDGTGHDGFAAAILEAMTALGIDKAHVCGLSLGGVVAIAMAALAPERCASLVLADSFAVHPEGQAIHDRSVEASERLGMRGLAEARVGALVGSAAPDSLRRDLVETMAGIDPAAYRKGAAAVWLADQRDRAAAIEVPTLVMVGAEDRITPPALSRDLVERIPGARLVEIERAGHLANIEQPLAFNSELDWFLQEFNK